MVEIIYEILGRVAEVILVALYAIGVPFEVCTVLSFVIVPILGAIVIVAIATEAVGGVVVVVKRWWKGKA